MKTKITSITAIICLIALSSCSMFNEGARYRLNKVEAISNTSDSQSLQNETVFENPQKSIMADSSIVVETILRADSGCNAVAPVSSVTKQHYSIDSPFSIFKTPSLQMNTRKTAIINKKSICVNQPSETKLGLFSICFILAAVFTLIGFIAGWSGAWILLILIGVVLPIIIVIVWILLIILSFNQNYSWGNS